MRRPLPAIALILAVGVVAGPASAGPAHPGQTINGPRWSPDFAAARHYARRRAGEVAFAMIGPDGTMHGFRAASTAPAASVFKVMLMTSYLRLPGVRDRPLRRSDKRLLRPMIRRSDSWAATLVRNIVGRRRVDRLAKRAGMRDFRWNPIWGLSRTSPRDQARFMYRLPRYIPARHRSFALRQLSRIVPSQRWGIGRVEPPHWHLFFKGGWGSGSGRVDHQVALLRHGSARLSLAMFTQFDPDHAYGKQTLRGLAARLLRGLPR